MTNRLTKRSVVTYTPTIPAVVGRPAYCTTQTQVVLEPVYKSIPSFTGLDTANDSALIDPTNSTRTSSQLSSYTLVPKTKQVTVCYPAVLAVKGQDAATVVDNQPGWNAGAKSAKNFQADGVARFSFPPDPAAAVICGLASSATVGEFAGIRHGLYTDGRSIRVVELGVFTHTFSIGSQSTPTLAIARVGSQVLYQAGSETYASALSSTGAQSLYAALYSAGDYVDTPSIGDAVRVTSSEPAGVSGYARESTGSATARSLQSYDGDGISGSAYAQDSSAEADPPVLVTSRVETVLPFAESALGNKIMAGAGVGTLDFEGYASDTPYATARGTLDLREQAVSTGADPLTENFFEVLAGRSYAASDFGIFATVTERLSLADHVDVGIFISATIFEHLNLLTSASFAALISASVTDRLILTDRQTTYTRALQYATNLVTGAVTRYENFGFTGYARTIGSSYGVKPDGLYRIGGDSDDGDAISAAVDFAATSFGSNERKGLQVLYFGVATDGQVFGRLVEDNGTERTYRVVQYQDTAKLVPAQRPTSRFWRLRLEVADASYFDLDSIDWFVVSANRRITQ